MTLSAKQKIVGVSVVLISLLAWVYSGFFSTQTLQQESIRVAGIKPADATVKVWANYRVFGEECESYSYDMFGQKAHKGGKFTTFFTQDEAESNDRYQFQVPYSTYTDGKNCTIELRDIKIEAYNAFSPQGFAQLRIYQAGSDYDNKPISLSSLIESKDCNSYVFKGLGNVWSGALGCFLFVDDKKISKKPNYNAEKVHFDFSQFTSDSVINYDILAGEDYRSEPLDPQTGK